MIKFFAGAVLVFVCTVPIFAQKLDHPLRAEEGIATVPSPRVLSFPDTLHVLAIMVQFKPYNGGLTTGNGQFDRSTAPQMIIDAPPRDSSYFADHLLFAQNYFTRASNGKQNISFTVLGKTLSLQDSMPKYSPVNSDLPLANLITDAWTAADAAYPSFPFQNYDLFVIFHAGAGKDIDLRSIIGYDPTPYDLPSIYFNLPALKNLFGAGYDGVVLPNHPSFKIPNSAILPETENRLLPALQGDELFQLGINGLVVADIGSHLGLPDLFDTKTGGTAIGRFGLMDGQSIFSFFGLFPPRPSAWEKIYLGWTTPITVPTGSTDLRLPAAGLYQTGDDTIYKVPISAKEYFLIENRNREIHGNGVTLTIRWNGTQFTRNYSQDVDDFNASNVDSIYGDIVDVDDLDWSLPGLIDASNNFPGGILIWHIDETVIDDNIASNMINANASDRGVNLEEADGSQDIGQTYSLLDAGSGSEDGSPLDYWFATNTSPVYKNIFNETSHPNSLSNSSAHSHVTIDQFGNFGDVMTLRTSLGDNTISLDKIIKLHSLKLDNNDAPVVADLDGDGKPELLYTDGDSIFALKDDLSPYFSNSTGLFSRYGGQFQLIVLKGFFGGANAQVVGVQDSTIYFFDGKDANMGGNADTLLAVNVGSLVTSPLSYSSPSLIGSNNGRVYIGKQHGATFLSSSGSGQPARMDTLVGGQPISGMSLVGSSTLFFTESGLYFVRTNGSNAVWNFSGKKILAASVARIDPDQPGDAGLYIVAVFDNGTFALINVGTQAVNTILLPNANGSLAFADVNGDGMVDILLGAGNQLFAFNRNGIIIDNFPIRTLDGGDIVGSPIVVTQASSNDVAIVFGSTNGQIYAVDENGKSLSGFPLQTSGIVSSPVLFGDKLVVPSTDSSLYIWKIGEMFDTSKILWGNFLGNVYHTNFEDNTARTVLRSSELLPTSLAYNWPNPVYDKSTHIRYYLSKSATVSIRIFNMAGELVAELPATGYGGLDNEVSWDVSHVQSGVYFAHIKAIANGEEKDAIIKIAVVK